MSSPRPRPYWTPARRAVAELHLHNKKFEPDLRAFLKAHGAPGELGRLDLALGPPKRAFVDFALRSLEGASTDQWARFLGDVDERRRRWPFLPEEFWHGSVDRHPRVKTEFGGLSQGSFPRFVEDPAAAPCAPGEAAPRRADMCRDLFERRTALLLVPVYRWMVGGPFPEARFKAALARAAELAMPVAPPPAEVPTSLTGRRMTQLRMELAATRASEAGVPWNSIVLQLAVEFRRAFYSEPRRRAAVLRLAAEARLKRRGLRRMQVFAEQTARFGPDWRDEIRDTLDLVQAFPRNVERKAGELGPR